MKFGVILETKEPEKAWNTFRFAVTSRKNGHEVKIFLMGKAVECGNLTHEGQNLPNITPRLPSKSRRSLSEIHPTSMPFT